MNMEIEIVGLVTVTDTEQAEFERSVEDEYQRLLTDDDGGDGSHAAPA